MKNSFLSLSYFLFVSTVFSYSAGIEGRVILKGQPLPDKVITAAKTRDCSHGGEIKTEFWKIGTNGGLGDVVVWIKQVSPEQAAITKTTAPIPLEIDQKGCRYVPHVSAVLVKEKIKIKNSDSTLHNVRGAQMIKNRKGRIMFNLAQPSQGTVNEVSFSQAGIYILECDVHPWMQAWVMALDNPFFAVTSDLGDYKLPLVPPGEYEVMAWHQKFLTPISKKIRVTNQTNEVNFEFVLETAKVQ